MGIHRRQCAWESLCKCWPRIGLLCDLCGPGPLFSVSTKSWGRFRCVHAPLAQRRPRRGAAPIVQIHWLQWPWESLYKGLPRSAFLNIRPAESLVPRRARRRPRDPRHGAVVDEAERGPGRTSEWGGSRPANPPGVVAGLGFRSREISRTRTTATRHHQAGRPGICDSYSVSDVQDLAQTAFRRRVFHEDVLAVQSTCRWEQPPNLAAGAGDNRTTAWAVTRSG